MSSQNRLIKQLGKSRKTTVKKPVKPIKPPTAPHVHNIVDKDDANTGAEVRLRVLLKQYTSNEKKARMSDAYRLMLIKQEINTDTELRTYPGLAEALTMPPVDFVSFAHQYVNKKPYKSFATAYANYLKHKEYVRVDESDQSGKDDDRSESEPEEIEPAYWQTAPVNKFARDAEDYVDDPVEFEPEEEDTHGQARFTKTIQHSQIESHALGKPLKKQPQPQQSIVWEVPLPTRGVDDWKYLDLHQIPDTVRIKLIGMLFDHHQSVTLFNHLKALLYTLVDAIGVYTTYHVLCQFQTSLVQNLHHFVQQNNITTDVYTLAPELQAEDVTTQEKVTTINQTIQYKQREHEDLINTLINTENTGEDSWKRTALVDVPDSVRDELVQQIPDWKRGRQLFDQLSLDETVERAIYIFAIYHVLCHYQTSLVKNLLQFIPKEYITDDMYTLAPELYDETKNVQDALIRAIQITQRGLMKYIQTLLDPYKRRAHTDNTVALPKIILKQTYMGDIDVSDSESEWPHGSEFALQPAKPRTQPRAQPQAVIPDLATQLRAYITRARRVMAISRKSATVLS